MELEKEKRKNEMVEKHKEKMELEKEKRREKMELEKEKRREKMMEKRSETNKI